MKTRDPLANFLDRILPKISVKNPSRESLARPYERGYPLTPNNVVAALGAPFITAPGATGTSGGPSLRSLEKKTIVYKDALPDGYAKVGGGYTFSGFDAPPTGGIFNGGQA